jgi:hypothetical protein
MKILQQFIFAKSLVFLASSLSICCGDITSGSLDVNAIAPSGGLGGSAIVEDANVNATADLLKISGVFKLENGDGGVGNSTGSYFKIAGGYDLEANEAFGLDYEIIVNLVGGGTVDFTTTATTNFNGVEEVLSNSESIAQAGVHTLTFGELGFAADTAGSGTWEGEFTFDWLNAPAGAELTVTVPTNSIDFSIQPQSVPEPNTFAVAMALAMGLVSRRRRLN